MLSLLFIWAVLSASLIALAIGRPREGGALTLSYFVGMSMIHVPGAFAFLSSVPILAKWGLGDRYATGLGFRMTVIGMAAFVVGAVLARVIDLPRAAKAQSTPGADTARSTPETQANSFQEVGRRAL